MIQILSLQLLMLFMDGQEFLPNWIMVFLPSFVTSSKLIIFCIVIILLHLIFSFLLAISLLVLYTYVSIISIDCILLSSFELKTTLLISSVKTLYLSLLNLCCVFNIGLFFLWIFITFSETMLVLLFARWFILFSSGVASKQLLWFSNLIFLFMTLFLCLLLFYLHYLCYYHL